MYQIIFICCLEFVAEHLLKIISYFVDFYIVLTLTFWLLYLCWLWLFVLLSSFISSFCSQIHCEQNEDIKRYKLAVGCLFPVCVFFLRQSDSDQYFCLNTCCCRNYKRLRGNTNYGKEENSNLSCSSKCFLMYFT